MKIHNFGYKPTRVSLKVLEVNMCMDSIEDFIHNHRNKYDFLLNFKAQEI